MNAFHTWWAILTTREQARMVKEDAAEAWDAATKAEREACAQVCDDAAAAANMMAHSSVLTDAGRMLHEGKWGGAMNCAAAIRARSNAGIQRASHSEAPLE